MVIDDNGEEKEGGGDERMRKMMKTEHSIMPQIWKKGFNDGTIKIP